MVRVAAVCMAMAAAAGPADGQEPLVFRPREILAWQPHEFDGRTHYELDRKNGRVSVQARCEAGGSGLFLRRTVDLRRTPSSL